MQTRHVLLVGSTAFAALLSQTASASIFEGFVCLGAKTSPYYWGIWASVQAARASGALQSRDDCELGGSVASDVGSTISLPTGVVTNCVCKDVFGDAPASKPICPIAHNVCTVGSKLPTDLARRADCVPSGSALIAADVCAMDPYCCSTDWDLTCVNEVTSSYWNREASQAIEWSVEARPNCAVNSSNAPTTPEAIAIYLAECPDNRITPQSALTAALNQANSAAANVRASDALCLEGAPSQLYAAGEFMDGNYDYSAFSTDWDYGFYKAQCAAGFAQIGLSVAPGFAEPHGVLCALATPDQFTAKRTATLTLPGDVRRATRTGNWAHGASKLECGINEYVYGVSQDPWTGQVHSVACASSSGLSSRSCHAVAFDSSGAAGDGDWDYGYLKAECTPSEYLAGVSVDPSTLTPNSMLCCTR